jgi:undecaprenyl-diphosphatase
MNRLLFICFALTLFYTGCHNKKQETTILIQSNTQQTTDLNKQKPSTVNSFDLSVVYFCQQFSRKSRLFDELLSFISKNNFFKGGVILIAFWWLWFPPNNQSTQLRRIKIILALLSGFAAIFIGRVLVICLPFRVRPLNNPNLQLNLPYGSENMSLDKLSSFPSDHAVLFFAIATGLLLIARKAGILAFIYTTIFITFSRVYLCFHYATDVLAGALLGITISYFVFNNNWMNKLGEKIYFFSERKPQFFYPLFFVLSFQLSNLFEELRAAITFVAHIL